MIELETRLLFCQLIYELSSMRDECHVDFIIAAAQQFDFYRTLIIVSLFSC